VPLQYFYAQFGGNLGAASPRAVALIGAAVRLVFHDGGLACDDSLRWSPAQPRCTPTSTAAAEYSPSTFGVSDWYRSDGCINTAEPENGGIAASSEARAWAVDVSWVE
jgi:hypothetical protein